MKYPGSRVAQFAFSDIFLREYGQMLKPKDWGCTNLDALILALGDIVEVRPLKNLLFVCLFFRSVGVGLSAGPFGPEIREKLEDGGGGGWVFQISN